MKSTRAPVLVWASRTQRRHRLVGTVLRAAAPLLPSRPQPTDPIFIVGCPRSGTTMLADLFDRSSRLASFGWGSQFLWEMFRPSDATNLRSHAVGPDEIAPTERKVLYWVIERMCGPGIRYLDRFPRNVLRVEYLHRLFPNAYFVYMRRDGRSVVSSLMTAWPTKGLFGQGTRLPVPLRIEGYDGEVWRFLIPPGWEEYATTGRSLAEVCAFQWVAGNEAVLAAKDTINVDRWFELSYEELVEAPAETTRRLFDAVRLPLDESVSSWAASLDEHVSKTAVTAPTRDKWRTEHPREIESVMPMLEPMLRRLGYSTEDSTAHTA